MEPPRKRQRLPRSTVPDADLQKRRARNDNRLKSIFESIFDKYGKDFAGIGDEIDLRTGEIVVNNGHLLGMTNERDAGQVESSFEELESEHLEEEEAEEEEEEEGHDTDEGDAALVIAPEIGLRKDYSVDYLMQDTDTEPLSTTFGRSLHGQIIDYGSEEDELADHAIEWVTPREARAIAHQKWQLPDDGLTFTDESIVEEAWRVPPLPKSAAACSNIQKAVPISGRLQEPLDLEEPGISLWASAERQCRRSRFAEPPRLNQSALDLPSPNGSGVKHGDSSRSRSDKTNPPWTKEEQDLLRHLKETTTLSSRKMDGYFPERSWRAIASKWTQMVNCGKASRIINKGVRREPTPTSPTAPCHARPIGKEDHQNAEQSFHQRQQSFEADIPSDHLTMTFASELSSIVQESVDGYLEPRSQPVDTFWSSGDYSKSDRGLSRNVSPTITNAPYLLEEMQRGLRVQYPADSHIDQIDQTVQASPPPIPVGSPDNNSGHAEAGVYVQGTRDPSILNHPQLHDAAPPPSRYPHRTEDDAAMRRSVCVDQIAKYAHVTASQEVEDDAASRRRVCTDQMVGYGLVIDPEGGPLSQAESSGQDIECEPVSDNVADAFVILGSSDAHRPEIAVVVPAQPKDKPPAAPALIQQGGSIPVPSVMPTQEITHSLSSPVNLGGAKKPKCVPLATLSGVEHVVQVLIPRLKSYEVRERTTPTKLGLEEETLVLPTPKDTQSQQNMVMPVSCEPDRGFSPSSEAPLNSEVVHDVEIPDSQPEFSSPIVVNNENADQTLINALSSKKTSPLARRVSVQPSNEPLANVDVPGSEFDDELSIVALRPKRSVVTLATTPVTLLQRSKAVTPLTRQAFKKWDSKVTQTTVDHSLSLLSSDMLDCGEDELSFQ